MTSNPIRRLCALGFVISVVATMDLLACGDKFVLFSRGTRFQRPPVRGSASILIYDNGTSGLSKALANVGVDGMLRKAGYHPTTVGTLAALHSALAKSDWDLILAEVTDVDAIRSHLRADDPVILLPVVLQATDAELKRLKKVHQRLLKAPTKSHAFLDAVDAALARPL
jgi:hypothetical protein